jgi:hypothetical protein
LVSAGEGLEEGSTRGPLPVIINHEEVFWTEGPVGDAEGMEFCQDFFTGGEVFESGGAGAHEFLDHKSNRPFAVAAITAAMLPASIRS